MTSAAFRPSWRRRPRIGPRGLGYGPWMRGIGDSNFGIHSVVLVACRRRKRLIDGSQNHQQIQACQVGGVPLGFGKWRFGDWGIVGRFWGSINYGLCLPVLIVLHFP